jgi:hypothetical protein
MNWFHSLIGEVRGLTPRELANMFPEQSLSTDDLTLVSKGKKNFYKGWRLVENVTLPVNGSPPMVRDWYHPYFGDILNKTLKEIADIDPGITNIETLRCVGLGIHVEHRGWRLYSNKNLRRRGRRYDWYHPKHGLVKGQTCRDLAVMYCLSLKNVQQVVCGMKHSHKGWTLSVNHNRKPNYTNQPKLMNWHHPVYGAMYNCCAGDLSKSFPEQNLDKNELRRISRHPGKYSYRGWKAEACKNL